MKVTFNISGLVSGLLVGLGLSVDKVVQACEATLNSRTEISNESGGLKNKPKDMRAESTATIGYVQSLTVVTAFIEYAEAKAGKVDKLAARAVKLGGALALSEIPEKFAGEMIRDWAVKTGTLTAVELKAIADAEAAQQAEAAKAAKKPAKELVAA